ncbi:aminotransferase class III-fold pyridoxal phosphate-dependent enzyme [Rhizobium rhizogenes]|uniref:aminotransferase class III-fold pyridoxal phosphate-dependent enzyme n=1 Tax=Rhizobium rhizogenes TaxID=359 RepID=UPI000674C4BB
MEASKELLRRARQVDALLDARPSLFFTGIERIGGYPLFVSRAAGPYIWDVDGNRYIDYILGYGSVVLGHAASAVEAAVAEARNELGANPTLLNVRQVELAEKIVSLVPGIESVAFLKTGTDATTAAVRLARAITRRRLIVRWGMNGWADWCAPVTAGVPVSVQDNTIVLSYNDIEQARAIFSKHGSEIACVIMMPYDQIAPAEGYLEELRQLCQLHGALFILDEIRSGFRVAMGGAQEYFGISADLVTFGKAIANGHAISVLAGRKAHMKHVLSIGMTVTYYRMPDAMAAANATIGELERNDGPNRLANFGLSLIEGINRTAQAAGIRAQMKGLACTPWLNFDYGERNNERALRMFCNGLLSRGILMSPVHHMFLCTAMTQNDVNQTISAASEVFDEIRHSLA